MPAAFPKPIGSLLIIATRTFQYGAVVAILTVIVVFMMAIELGCGALRRRLRS